LRYRVFSSSDGEIRGRLYQLDLQSKEERT